MAKAAWSYLIAAFITEAVTWAMPATYGVLLDAYASSSIGQQPQAAAMLPVVGLLAQAGMYLLGPPAFLLCNWRPNWRQRSIWIGSAVSVVSLVAASFASEPWHLLLTQGFLYSIGGALQYYATMSYLMEWFIDRRGLANGICFSGTAVGGLFLPYVYRALIDRYSISTTLRAVACGQACLLALAQPMIKGRLPPIHAQQRRQSLGYTKEIFSNRLLWLFLAINMLQSAAAFMPNLWLPSFISAMPSVNSTAAGPASVVAYQAAAVVGRLVLGVLSDKYQPHFLGSVSCLAAALSTFLLWGLAGQHHLGAVLTFAAFFGLVAAGFSSLWTGVMKQVAGSAMPASNVLFGMCTLSRGMGVVISGPITARIRGDGAGTSSFWPIIVYTGSTMAAAGSLQLVDAFLTRKTHKVS